MTVLLSAVLLLLYLCCSSNEQRRQVDSRTEYTPVRKIIWQQWQKEQPYFDLWLALAVAGSLGTTEVNAWYLVAT